MYGTMYLFLITTLTVLSSYNAEDDFFKKNFLRESPYHGSANAPVLTPVDKSDEIFQQDFWVNPDSNIMYNFEHLRKDQPSHVEQRVEHVGNYLNRQRKTTTRPQFAKSHRKHEKEVKKLSASESYESESSEAGNWDLKLKIETTSAPKSFPSLPDAPVLTKFGSSDEASKENYFVTSKYSTTRRRNHIPTTTVTPSQTVRNINSDPKHSRSSHRRISPLFVPEFPKTQQEELNIMTPKSRNHRHKFNERITTPSIPIIINSRSSDSNSDEEVVTTRRPHHSRHGSTERGKHRFNFDDFTKPQVTTEPPAPTGPFNKHNPPPVPTLTPWYDGFRK